jgi:hypothetical protein
MALGPRKSLMRSVTLVGLGPQPVAGALNSALQEQNFRVVPFPNGQVVGHQNEIRVFDVQHIKGLEFEAVFFVDSLLPKKRTSFLDICTLAQRAQPLISASPVATLYRTC